MRPLILICCLFAATIAGKVCAELPLTTDDAGTADPRGCEIEHYVARATGTSNLQGETTFLYGVTGNFEIGGFAGYGWPTEQSVGAPTIPGLQCKWRFANDAKSDTAMALSLSNLFPHHTPSYRSSGDYCALLIMTRQTGPRAVHVNLGYDWIGDTGAPDEIAWGIAYENQRTQRFAFVTEVYGSSFPSDVAPAKTDAVYFAGFRYNPTDALTYSGGLGYDLTGSSEPRNFNLGLTLDF